MDADTLRTIIEGALGALAMLLGKDALDRRRNGRAARNADKAKASESDARPPFEEEARTRPGFAPPCTAMQERMSRGEVHAKVVDAKMSALNARVAAVEDTKHD